MSFQPIETGPVGDLGGESMRYRFANDYGASVVRHGFSYGGPEGLWELAVIHYDASGDWRIIYDTPITDDVLGRLDNAEVDALLAKIEKLTPRAPR